MITREQKREVLSNVELFRDLGERDLRVLVALVREESYARDETIWRQGELGTTFYVVLEGQVGAKVVDEGGLERLDRTLSPEDAFGETSLLTGEMHEATMVALTDCSLLSILKVEFDELVRQRRGMARRLRMREEVRRKYELPRFAWLEPGEVPALFQRRHPAHMVPRLALLVGLLMIGTLIGAVGAGGSSSAVLLWPGLFLMLAGSLGTMWVVVDWRNDFLMVTNRRVVQMEKVLLFSEVRSEAGLEQIQNVAVGIGGVIHHMLAVGNVWLETAGETGQIGFTFVSGPDEIRDMIFTQISRAVALQRAAGRGEIRRELERHLGREPEGEPETLPGEAEREQPIPKSQPALLGKVGGALGRFVPRVREEKDGVVTWRKHWLLLLRKTGLQMLLLIVFGIVGIAMSEKGEVCFPLAFLWVGFFLWWWYRYEDWRNDVYQIAGGRIIDMTRRPLWGREVRKEGELARIQNVTYQVQGMVQNILNVGDVLIETAGRTANFDFKGVYNPKEVANEIWRRLARQRRVEDQKRRERQQQDLAEWFEEYSRLVGEGGGSERPVDE